MRVVQDQDVSLGPVKILRRLHSDHRDLIALIWINSCMGYCLNSLNGDIYIYTYIYIYIQGTTVGVIKGDIRSLDYGSYSNL